MPSPSVRAERLSFSFSERVLLDGVTFHLAPGWTGLVGANGSGKSTLLALLAGSLVPTGGTIRREPRDARVVSCPQRVEALTADVERFADAHDGSARRLHGQLALDPSSLSRWPTLSPGERKRWQLGAALWSEPDVLLLDEPTNHLDVEATELVREALRRFRGVGVLVSHDRALLDALTGATLRLDRGGVRAFSGAFSVAAAAWAEEDREVREAQRETKRRLESESRRLDDARRRLAASARSRSAGQRMRNGSDSDARSLGADFRAEMAEKAHAAQLRRSLARADEVQAKLDALEVRDEAGRSLFVRYEPAPRRLIVTAPREVLLPDGTPLLRDVSFSLERDAHVVIEGPNGAGKSTLLRALVEAAALPPERVLELSQELTQAEAEEDLRTVRALPPEVRGRVLQLVHALGVEPDDLLATSAPSPGEARKLRLALGLGRHAWLAVLDEPTNHLDLPAIERLEAALVEFPGALVVVTHDQRLAARVATRRLRVEGGRVHAS